MQVLSNLRQVIAVELCKVELLINFAARGMAQHSLLKPDAKARRVYPLMTQRMMNAVIPSPLSLVKGLDYMDMSASLTAEIVSRQLCLTKTSWGNRTPRSPSVTLCTMRAPSFGRRNRRKNVRWTSPRTVIRRGLRHRMYLRDSSGWNARARGSCY